jgi:hypothetical protein
VLAGRVRSEALVVHGPRSVQEYGAGDSFSAPETGIHRMDHEPGAVTIHVYSPPLTEIGHYDVVDGELRRRAGHPDEASPPSPGLAAPTGTRRYRPSGRGPRQARGPGRLPRPHP